MAIIQCPECGKNISDKAVDCIHCGFPLKRETSSLNGTLVIYGYTGFFFAYPELKIYLDGQYICDVAHESKSAVIPINKPTEVEIKCGMRSTLVRVRPDMHSEIYTEFDRSSGNILVDLKCSPLGVKSSPSSSTTASAAPNSSESDQVSQVIIQKNNAKTLRIIGVIAVIIVAVVIFAQFYSNRNKLNGEWILGNNSSLTFFEDGTALWKSDVGSRTFDYSTNENIMTWYFNGTPYSYTWEIRDGALYVDGQYYGTRR